MRVPLTRDLFYINQYINGNDVVILKEKNLERKYFFFNNNKNEENQ